MIIKTRCLLLATIAALWAAPAAAQTRAAEDGAQSLDPVFITQTGTPREIRGRLIELSAESVGILDEDGHRLDLPLDSVLRIERRGDSLKNGAVIGALVMGAWCAYVCRVIDGGVYLGAVVFDTGLGALVGAGIDALHSGRTPIYQRDAAPAGPSTRRNGVFFRIRF